MKSLLLTILLAVSAQAATYTFTTLQYPGAQGTYPVSINKTGTVAGYYFDSGFSGHGFTYSNGTYTSIEAGSACYSTFVTGINDAGVLAGYCFANKGGTLNFVDRNGVFRFYSLTGILDSYTEAINNSNTTVGWLITNANTISSFYAVSGAPKRTFAAPNALNATAAYGINNKGVIVGNGIPVAYQEGFIEQNNVFTFYAYPGAYQTFFNGVNDQLQVVGDENKVARGPVTALLFENGTYTDIVVPDATGSVATGINAASSYCGILRHGIWKHFLQCFRFHRYAPAIALA